MSSDSPLDQASRGAAKGLLDFGKEELTAFVERLKNKELWFVQDSSIIARIRAQRLTPAWGFYKTYVRSPLFLHLVQLGLALRDLEDDDTKRQKLRSSIVKGYGTKELHIAEFIASKTLSRYIATRIDTVRSMKDLVADIEGIFNNIDRDYRFIQSKDDPNQIAADVIAYLRGSLPELVILVSKGSAIRNCRKIIATIENSVADYEVEVAGTEDLERPEAEPALYAPKKQEYVAFIRRLERG